MLGRGVARRGFQRPAKLEEQNHMAPTFYHYSPVPMEKTWDKQGLGTRRCKLVVAVLMFLISAVLVTLLTYFAVRANSKACRDGLRAQEECRNTTHLLQRQLTRAQENLQQSETQANTCNQTVVRLETVPSKARVTGEATLKLPSKSQSHAGTPATEDLEIQGDLETPHSSETRGLSILPSRTLRGSPNFVEGAEVEELKTDLEDHRSFS